MQLIIGNKRYSSWSLRPWLVATHFNIPFEEILILLDQPDTDAKIARYSPAGKVPALVVDGQSIWDSLAICEYWADRYPDKKLWPTDIKARAHARAISCEMHSGFQTMREVMSHNLQRSDKTFTSQAAQEDIDRVKAIWMDCLRRYQGPFLFGREFTIADAMYAPVVNRFISYAVPTSETEIAAYIKTIRELAAHQKWIEAGLKETYEAPEH